MRNLHEIDNLRSYAPEIERAYGGFGDHQNGAFVVPSPIDHAPLFCIASVGSGWEHVSIRRRNRCPNWPEMERVRKLFFNPDEVVIQLHVPESEHINYAVNCLHLWRPLGYVIPTPPLWMVGPKQENEDAETETENATIEP